MVELYIMAGVGVVVGGVVAHSAVKTVWRKVFRAKVKGHAGESKVRKTLKSFSRRGARDKNDILIPGKRNTFQIDHLLISRHGIFVIETKNYSGIIQGREDSNLWRQIFPDGNSSPRDFFNPLKQNKGHINALRAILGDNYKNVPIHSLVVFPDKTLFPEVPGVFSNRELKSAIKFMSRGEPVLSAAQVNEISKIVDENTIKNRNARSMHNMRAGLSAAGNDPEAVNELIEHSLQNSVYLRTSPIEIPPQQSDEIPEKALLTDNHAKLEIRGRQDTIDGFFEAAKRREDGQPVPPGGNFDYFVCPFTGDKFPPSEAINMYRGLWITYLNKNPNLVAYMKENGTENLGNSFRCRKALTLYNTNKENFVSDVRRSDWYVNMASKYREKRASKDKKRLDDKIQTASQKTAKAQSSFTGKVKTTGYEH